MKSLRCLLMFTFASTAVVGNAVATPWFADNFDSYGSNGVADQTAFQAAWSWSPEYYDLSGFIIYDGPNWLGDPFAWQMKKGMKIRARRSLIPSIQAADPSKNAVKATAANPLVLKFQTVLGSSAITSDDKTILWLELVGQEITSGNLDDKFSAPVKNPGSYGTALGVCDTSSGTGTCTAGWFKMVGKGCNINSDCDTPMWLDFLPSTTGSCTVLDHTLSVSRPSLAFGAYGGTNGLIPKPEPGNNCSALTNLALGGMVTFDGDQWSRLSPVAPAGSSADAIETSRNTTNVQLTIRETDYDVAVEQPVTCDFAGRCDNVATCMSAAIGTCVDHVCSNNGNACSIDLDCNFCSDDITQKCSGDGSCRSFTCEGGLNEGNGCLQDTECVDQSHTVCMGGSTDGASCAETAGSLSDSCGPKTITKSHIPRKYTGPFQTIAMGPGHVFDGNSNLKQGSDYPGYIDTIEITGGEFVTLPSGACCMPDDSCVPGVLEAACTQVEGAFYAGDNVTCEQARCNAGACCTDQGCIGEKTQAECEALGGQYQGRGSACDGTTCKGACCEPKGVCTDSMITECAGNFRGPGTDCASSIPCCPTPYPDWDGDHDVDSADFAFLQRCLLDTAGQEVVEPSCACMDHNHDGLINAVDVDLFIGCATGPGVVSGTVSPECMP